MLNNFFTIQPLLLCYTPFQSQWLINLLKYAQILVCTSISLAAAVSHSF